MPLHRLTGLVAGRRFKWITLGLWVVITAILAPLGTRLSDVSRNRAIDYLPRSAEATQAYQRAQAAFPESNQLLAVVVYVRDSGLTPADRSAVAANRAAFARYAVDGKVSPPVPSKDNKALLLSFPVAGNENVQTSAITEIKDLLASQTPPGLQAALTGPAGSVSDAIDAFSGLDSTLLFFTAGVVAIILLITYRSPTLWIIPLVSVGIASQVGAAVVYLLARAGALTVNGQSQGILTVLIFGAGTDYALLLTARYREELRRHRNRHEAMAVALSRSYPALLASASTVILGLLCLLAAELNNIRSLGPVAAIGIAIAFLSMTTLLPALLVVGGRWLFWPFVPRYDETAQAHDIAEEHGIWRRIAALVGRRPRTVWIGTSVALAGLAFGSLTLSTGLTQADQFTTTVGSVTGQRLVDEHYPGGSTSPVLIYAAASQAGQVATVVRGVRGVDSVPPPVVSPDGRWARVDAILADPPTSAAAKSTVGRIRTVAHAVPGAEAVVGGETAIQIDTERATMRDNEVVIPLILVVVFLVLVALLRALIAPLVLIASVVLSYGAGVGTAALIFYVLGYSTIDLGLPLITFLFLVALGVDYTIFLMTRAREETVSLGHRTGILHALTVTGGVITSAGVVLAATFSVLTVLPLVALLHIGVVVAVGVLIDTLIVRTLLVPALSIDIGRRIWWPGRLSTMPDPGPPGPPPGAPPEASPEGG